LKTQNKFWLIIAVALGATVAALCTVGWLFWKSLGLDNQLLVSSIVIEHFAYFFSAGFILLLAFGFAADWIFRAYVRPINRLAEEIDLINTVNPDLRVTVRGSFDVRRLAGIINQSAELVARLRKSQAEKLKAAQSEIENERAILATLLSDLPQGIVVCNLDGRIVFYNRKARGLLSQSEATAGAAGSGHPWVGLGRSVYEFIDRGLIRNALGRIAEALNRDHRTVSERFIVSIKPKSSVLPAELLPVLDSQHHVTGFIIYVEDLTSRMSQAKERSRHIQLWQHQLTQSISVIKAIADILKDPSFASDSEYLQMVQVLSEQSDAAAQMWSRKSVTDPFNGKSTWPLTAISASQWAQHIQQSLNLELSLQLNLDPQDLPTYISIDIYHMTRVVAIALEKVRELSGVNESMAHFYQKDDWLYVDILWKGPGIGEDALKQWKAQVCGGPDDRCDIVIGDILTFHGAKLWPHRRPDQPDCGGLRLLIPTLEDTEPGDDNGRVTILPESRPEFYDFNLFQQAGHRPDLDNRRLGDLTFTVFDCETTGLDPSGGDEIISIGAIRIVNGRLLKDEQFSQLVDPKRHLPWESVKYHGIRPEMLVDQPTIERVLPAFQRFVQDTILVGHNVAFDMRMLQVKESLTGIRFDNPVLDTMLLSSVVHPAQEDHSLNAIAQRLGVQIVGRHTAMGDALATAEIFLKLISLLGAKDIHTLFDAREASKTSYYARLKY
jgi:DNA polymerase-3 subunit epsilon